MDLLRSSNMSLFPTVLDSTILSSWKRCKQLFFREYIENWKPQGVSIHLHAGAAYAKGLEVARKNFYQIGCSAEVAIDLGEEALIEAYGTYDAGDHAKNLSGMQRAFAFHFKEFPLGSDDAIPITLTDGSRAIEFSFAFPLPINNPDTGEPILYAGRCDMVVDWQDGIYTFDDKTTTRSGSSDKWRLRSQFSGYVYALRLYGYPCDGALIREIVLLKKDFKINHHFSPRTDFLIDRWYENLCSEVTEITRQYKAWKNDDRNIWIYNLDDGCNAFMSPCSFTRICESPDPESWLEMSHEKRIWNPLTREETKL